MTSVPMLIHKGRIEASSDHAAAALIWHRFPRAVKVVIVGPVNARGDMYEWTVMMLLEDEAETTT